MYNLPKYLFGRFACCERGQVVLIFGLMLPLLITAVAGSVDYAHWLSNRTEMQNAADSAALAGAKELRLASADPIAVASVARRRALAELGAGAESATVKARVINLSAVQVDIDEQPASIFGSLAPSAFAHIHVTALAKTASTPSCLIALNPQAQGVDLDTAAIIALNCMVYSDSGLQDGFHLHLGTVTAAKTCSAGGVKVDIGVILPPPITDCPSLSDPLISRAPPPVNGCDYQNKVVSQGSDTLYPGTYCGGLTITNGATVTLNSGVYVMKDGPLAIDKMGSMQGSDVGFYFTGQNAVLNLDLLSNVNLVAPKDGPMAGILMFEDRSAPLGQAHLLGSRSATQLVGAIYFSRGHLTIGAKLVDTVLSALALNLAACTKLSLAFPCAPPQVNIGAISSWTIIIAGQITVNFGVNLVLNANYSSGTTAPPSELAFSGASLTR